MIARVALIFSALCLSGTAGAATRTVCYEIQIADSRPDCPDDQTPGARRPCNTGGTAGIEGFRYEAWDKDAGGTDDYLAAFTVGGTGTRCFTFEWEGSAAYTADGPGEANPDVYLKLNPIIRKNDGSGIKVLGQNGAGAALPDITWRDGRLGGPADEFVAVDCPNGANCTIGSTMIAVDDVNTSGALAVMAMDTMQRAVQVFSGSMNCTSDVAFHIDAAANLQYACSVPCTISRTYIQTSYTDGNDMESMAHEFGHVLQMCEFSQDTLIDDCTKNNGNQAWGLGTDEYNSCSTTEGFASWVALAAWWNPAELTAVPFYNTKDMEEEDLMTQANGSCTTAATLPGQVVKAFWDLSDQNNESSVAPGSGGDDQFISVDAILNKWDTFANGTANRQDEENSVHGVNIWDYQVNGATDVDTTIYHNCLGNQQF